MHWDLTHLHENQDSLDNALDKAQQEAEKFEKKYKNQLKKLDESDFLKALKKYESINETIGRAMTYVFLQFATDSGKGAFFAKYRERCNPIQERLLFFTLEFGQLKAKQQDKIIAKGKSYSYFLQLLKEAKKHQLSFKEERILLKKDPVMGSGYSRLFDEHLSGIKFRFGNKTVTEEEVLSLLYDVDRETRKKAAVSLSNGLKPSLPILAYIFNMIRADLKSDCELRQYKTPEEPRHKDNQISQKSVDALVDTTLKSTHMVRDYYKTKARILGLNTLYDYDRYAPIGKSTQEFGFEESKALVLEAFEAFHPKFHEIASLAFEEKWIDAFPKEGKRGGAFSHGAVPSTHPYVMLNHTNRRRDVFTLAHELGHAIHQYLSRDVGYLGSDTPLTTAETASVFAEMLLFDRLAENLDGEEKLNLYAGKVEDIFATLFRQIIFTTFERRVHAHEGELSVAEFSAFWKEENEKMFDGSVRLTKNYESWWSYIPHFIHSPFYCYAYSYGQLLVLALFGLYKRGFDGFEKRYIQFLSSGGSRSPKELVALFGYNIDDKKFWKIGLGEVEALVEKFMEAAHDR